jgi:hypothetical protein
MPAALQEAGEPPTPNGLHEPAAGTGRLTFAMVCASNMNRSMEAHAMLKKHGYQVRASSVRVCACMPAQPPACTQRCPAFKPLDSFCRWSHSVSVHESSCQARHSGSPTCTHLAHPMKPFSTILRARWAEQVIGALAHHDRWWLCTANGSSGMRTRNQHPGAAAIFPHRTRSCTRAMGCCACCGAMWASSAPRSAGRTTREL